MAFNHSLDYEPGPLYDSETLNRQHRIGGTGRSETTTRSKEGRKRMLIETNQNHKSFSYRLVGYSLFHKINSPLSSFSASRYRLSEYPFLIIKTIS